MKLLRTAFVATAFLVASTAATASVVFQLSGTTLIGATGVDVGGTKYDVVFTDGACTTLFGGCDAVGDFAFQTQASALLASQALLDQVLLDSASGNFDTDPALVSGCTTTTSNCFIQTPYALDADRNRVLVALAVNDVGVSDSTNTGDSVRDANMSSFPDLTYAVWTRSASAVPEPGSLALVGLALSGLGAARRSKPAA